MQNGMGKGKISKSNLVWSGYKDGKKRKCHLWTGGINPKSDNQVEITSHNHKWIKVDTFKIMFS